uniref:Glutamate receptor 2 plant n=1 Tax=Solanum tuberosum TaxID=4113 RepID=M1A3T1_SOLTU
MASYGTNLHRQSIRRRNNPFFSRRIGEINTRIPYRSVIFEFTTLDQIKSELLKLMNMQARVFIVHMSISLGSKLFALAKEIGMMSEGFVWIVTDAMANQLNLMDVSVIESMEVKPYVPKSNKVEDFIQRWKMKFRKENPRIVDV